jgi:hypothetical protein
VRAGEGGDRGVDEPSDTEPEVSAEEAAHAAMQVISDLTGKDPIGATAVEPTDDGWLVDVEVVEETHIPSSADVLALYQVDLDLDATLVSYRRTQRYPRGSRINENSGDRR